MKMVLGWIAAMLVGQAVQEVVYVPVGGQHPEIMRAIEAALPDMAPEGVRLRRASLDRSAMEACAAVRGFSDNVDRCVRRLVPREDGGAPVVAMLIGEDEISNVTGSRVHLRHRLRCVGHRSVAVAQLGDRNVGETFVHEAGMNAEVRDCIAKAMTPRNAALLIEGRDAPLWRLTFARYRAGDANHARGLGSEEGDGVIEELWRTPDGRSGDCRVKARLTSAEAYYFLRAGDRIEAYVPCAGANREAFGRVIAPEGLGRGSRVRVHVDADGELLFVEPL